MALLQNANVYMETVEETETKAAEPDENGSTKRIGMAGSNEQTELLVHNTYSSGKHDNNKRKTDKQWFL